jgi:RNA polymerase sigma-70 factor (ECF subfamily)
MDTTPPTLLERLRRPSDAAAWARFVELYTPLLDSWARRMGLQESDADDLIQEVFAQLLAKLPTFVYDKDRSFRGWLRTLALNRWRTMQRSRRDRTVALDADELPAPEAEAFWEQEYRHHLVGRAVAVMKAEFQPTSWQACWETVVKGRPAAEVGAELGLSAEAVRAAKYRVLARLRQELDGLLD